jgi:hypothetical protein
MCFKAANDPCICGLNMSNQISREVLNHNICEIIRWAVCTTVILEQEDLVPLTSQLCIPVTKPFLMKDSGYPGLCVILIVETKLCSCFSLKWLWLLKVPSDDGFELFCTSGIDHECMGQSLFVALHSRRWLVDWATVWRHSEGAIVSTQNYSKWTNLAHTQKSPVSSILKMTFKPKPMLPDKFANSLALVLNILRVCRTSLAMLLVAPQTTLFL